MVKSLGELVVQLEAWVATQYAAGVSRESLHDQMCGLVDIFCREPCVSVDACGSSVGVCVLSTVAGANKGTNKTHDVVGEAGIDKPRESGDLAAAKEALELERRRIRNGLKRRRNRANRQARRGVAPPSLTEFEKKKLDLEERKLELEALRSRAYVESRGNAAFRAELDVKRTEAYVVSQTALARQSYANAVKTGAPTIVSRVTPAGSTHSVTRSASVDELDAILSPKDSVSQQSVGSGMVEVPEGYAVMKKLDMNVMGDAVGRYRHDGVDGYIIPHNRRCHGSFPITIPGFEGFYGKVNFVPGDYIEFDAVAMVRILGRSSFAKEYDNAHKREDGMY